MCFGHTHTCNGIPQKTETGRMGSEETGRETDEDEDEKEDETPERQRSKMG